jgi:hypothetical protein
MGSRASGFRSRWPRCQKCDRPFPKAKLFETQRGVERQGAGFLRLLSRRRFWTQPSSARPLARHAE